MNEIYELLNTEKEIMCRLYQNCNKCQYFKGFDKEYHCSLIQEIDKIEKSENQNI